MDKKTGIFIVDDHQLVIDGLIAMLKDHPSWEILGYANDGREAVRRIPLLAPEIVLMDLDMPVMNGFQASEKLIKQIPEIKIVILTLHYEKAIFQKLMNIGISGYILKNSPKEEFLRGLEIVNTGSRFYSSTLTESILDVSTLKIKRETNLKLYSLLSDREKEILNLLAEGISTREMADSLHLSPKTIETYRKNLMDKLKAKNSADLIRIAIKEGFIDI